MPTLALARPLLPPQAGLGTTFGLPAVISPREVERIGTGTSAMDGTRRSNFPDQAQA